MKSLKIMKMMLAISILSIFIACGSSDDKKDTPPSSGGGSFVDSGNQSPTANAGTDKSVIVNQPITLIGTATDSDGTIVSYEWKKGNDVLATTASFQYTPTIVGTDILTLTVTDNNGNSVSDTVTITVQPEDSTSKINLSQYLPSRNMTKYYIDKYRFIDDDKETIEYNKETITLQGNVIRLYSYESDETETITISDESITLRHSVGTSSYPKYVNINDTVNWYQMTCTVEEKLNSFSHGSFSYSGDILKWKCGTRLYYYFKKDIGLIAEIDNSDGEYSYSYYSSTDKSNNEEEEESTDDTNTTDGSFSRNNETQIVTDSLRNLMWQDNEDAKTIEKVWITSESYENEEFFNVTGDTAVNYCENLLLGGYSDWKLPSKDDLNSIVERNPNDANNYNFGTKRSFQNVIYGVGNAYWTSTTDTEDSSLAWLIHASGQAKPRITGKWLDNYVRCVRNK